MSNSFVDRAGEPLGPHNFHPDEMVEHLRSKLRTAIDALKRALDGLSGDSLLEVNFQYVNLQTRNCIDSASIVQRASCTLASLMQDMEDVAATPLAVEKENTLAALEAQFRSKGGA